MLRFAWQPLVLALASGFGAGDAFAYVRELTSTGQPIAWRHPCVAMHLNLDAPPPGLTPAGVFTATTQAMAAWSYPQVACTDIRLDLIAEPRASLRASYDKKNVIVFRQDDWCRDSTDDPGDDMPECYPTMALAVTSVFKNKETGEILDTDIEFNTVYFTWGDLVGQPALATTGTADFQNALTHELGHVVGLDHNCYTSNDGAIRPYDNTGALALDCYGSPDPPPAIADATMYPSVTLSDTARRTLSPDDLLGVCEIYPHLHEECPTASGGCRVAAPTASPRQAAWPERLGAWLALLVVLTVGRLLRRRRSDPGASCDRT
jgi:hypothetical protein